MKLAVKPSCPVWKALRRGGVAVKAEVEVTMKYEVKESPQQRGAYLAVAVNEASHNEIFSALFSGPDAKRRAEEYAAWKNAELEPTVEELLRR
jgi:hypothetical protein